MGYDFRDIKQVPFPKVSSHQFQNLFHKIYCFTSVRDKAENRGSSKT